jgi:GDP-4-dehydro-6-deoxy-D-mannose reductase
MRVVVTGITGFVGSHLAEFLLAQGGIEVHGLVRWRSKLENIQLLLNQLKLHECDLRDAVSVRTIIEQIRPERIFHLAAQSFVPTSWKAPTETLTTNIVGQVNLLEAVRTSGVQCGIQIAGSSEEYGMVLENEVPIREENPLRPLSPYAVSKVGQDLLGYQYYQSYKMPIVRTRGFNHSGPRRGDVFVESNFAKQIAAIELGLQPPVILVGNLTARRDFTDVRDMVRGYWLALEKGKHGEVYNIASGKDYTIRQILDLLLEYSTVKVKIETDPDRLRPSDVPILLGDSAKFRRATGWAPTIPFEKTLEDLLNYWRAELQKTESNTHFTSKVIR